jgi:hypothetical protein
VGLGGRMGLRHPRRDDLKSTATRVAGALGTGTLVRGLFTALRPDQVKHLLDALVLLALLPFLDLVFPNAYGPLRLYGALRSLDRRWGDTSGLRLSRERKSTRRHEGSTTSKRGSLFTSCTVMPSVDAYSANPIAVA